MTNNVYIKDYDDLDNELKQEIDSYYEKETEISVYDFEDYENTDRILISSKGKIDLITKINEGKVYNYFNIINNSNGKIIKKRTLKEAVEIYNKI